MKEKNGRKLTAKDWAFIKEREKLNKKNREEREAKLAALRELEEVKKERDLLVARLQEFEKYKDLDSDKLHEHIRNTEKLAKMFSSFGIMLDR